MSLDPKFPVRYRQLILKRGFLFKVKGSTHQKFRRLYVLSPGRLSKFSHPEDPRPTRVIPLVPNETKCLSSSQLGEEAMGDSLAFAIVNPNRTFYFSSDSRSSYVEWVSAIESAIRQFDPMHVGRRVSSPIILNEMQRIEKLNSLVTHISQRIEEIQKAHDDDESASAHRDSGYTSKLKEIAERSDDPEMKKRLERKKLAISIELEWIQTKLQLANIELLLYQIEEERLEHGALTESLQMVESGARKHRSRLRDLNRKFIQLLLDDFVMREEESKRQEKEWEARWSEEKERFQMEKSSLITSPEKEKEREKSPKTPRSIDHGTPKSASSAAMLSAQFPSDDSSPAILPQVLSDSDLVALSDEVRRLREHSSHWDHFGFFSLARFQLQDKVQLTKKISQMDMEEKSRYLRRKEEERSWMSWCFLREKSSVPVMIPYWFSFRSDGRAWDKRVSADCEMIFAHRFVDLQTHVTSIARMFQKQNEISDSVFLERRANLKSAIWSKYRILLEFKRHLLKEWMRQGDLYSWDCGDTRIEVLASLNRRLEADPDSVPLVVMTQQLEIELQLLEKENWYRAVKEIEGLQTVFQNELELCLYYERNLIEFLEVRRTGRAHVVEGESEDDRMHGSITGSAAVVSSSAELEGHDDIVRRLRELESKMDEISRRNLQRTRQRGLSVASKRRGKRPPQTFHENSLDERFNMIWLRQQFKYDLQLKALRKKISFLITQLELVTEKKKQLKGVSEKLDDAAGSVLNPFIEDLFMSERATKELKEMTDVVHDVAEMEYFCMVYHYMEEGLGSESSMSPVTMHHHRSQTVHQEPMTSSDSSRQSIHSQTSMDDSDSRSSITSPSSSSSLFQYNERNVKDERRKRRIAGLSGQLSPFQFQTLTFGMVPSQQKISKSTSMETFRMFSPELIQDLAERKETFSLHILKKILTEYNAPENLFIKDYVGKCKRPILSEFSDRLGGHGLMSNGEKHDDDDDDDVDAPLPLAGDVDHPVEMDVSVSSPFMGAIDAALGAVSNDGDDVGTSALPGSYQEPFLSDDDYYDDDDEDDEDDDDDDDDDREEENVDGDAEEKANVGGTVKSGDQPCAVSPKESKGAETDIHSNDCDGIDEITDSLEQSTTMEKETQDDSGAQSRTKSSKETTDTKPPARRLSQHLPQTREEYLNRIRDFLDELVDFTKTNRKQLTECVRDFKIFQLFEDEVFQRLGKAPLEFVSNSWKELDDELMHRYIALRGFTPKKFLVPESFCHDEEALVDALKPCAEKLREIKEKLTPLGKLSIVHACSKMIFAALESVRPKLPIGSDDYTPVLIYVVVQAGIEGIVSEIQFCKLYSHHDFLPDPEFAYNLASLEVAVEYIRDVSRGIES